MRYKTIKDLHPREDGLNKKTEVKEEVLILCGLGIAEICLGFVSVTLGTALLCVAEADDWVHSKYTVTGQGLWCGFPLIVCGLFELKSVCDRKICAIDSVGMHITCLTTVTSLFLIILSFRGASYGYNVKKELFALHGTAVIVGLLSFMICIVHLAYLCMENGILAINRARRRKRNRRIRRTYNLMHVGNGKYAVVPFIGKYDIPSGVTKIVSA